MDIGRLFLTFLLIIFALALTPTIGDSVFNVLWNSSKANRIATNITGPARDIIGLLPLVWVFIVIGVGASAVVMMFEDM